MSKHRIGLPAFSQDCTCSEGPTSIQAFGTQKGIPKQGFCFEPFRSNGLTESFLTHEHHCTEEEFLLVADHI